MRKHKLLSGWGRDTVRRCARTGIMGIIRMRAHHTGTTVLVGSTAASSSVLARGSAADSLGVPASDADLIGGSAVADLTVDSATVDLIGDPATVDSRDVEQLEAEPAAVWHAGVAVTAAAFAVEVVPMVEAVRTAGAVTAADTGKFQQ
jgi:hypothetical protein